MDETPAAGLPHPFQLGVPVPQPRHEGAPGPPAAGVHHHAGGLVDDDEVLVFVEHVEADRFGGEVLLGLGSGHGYH